MQRAKGEDAMGKGTGISGQTDKMCPAAGATRLNMATTWRAEGRRGPEIEAILYDDEGIP
jgi:hypothetical protein